MGQEHRIDDYLKSLENEAQVYRGTSVETVYIGGGTPSLLNEPQLKRLVELIKKNFKFSPSTEFSLEANPESLTLKKAEFLRTLGINRVSLGIQSLNDRYLKFLGRIHDGSTAQEAFAILRKAGFDNINVDLMYSFPGQTDTEIEEDIHKITPLQSEHISLYTLTIEEHSRFFAQDVRLANDQTLSRQYQLVVKLLEEAGYYQYEVSNFAKAGKESKHNLNYWRGGNYFGLGVGAHAHHEGTRSWNVSKFAEYLTLMNGPRSAKAGEERLIRPERFMEMFLIGLRMNDGVDLNILQERIGTDLPQEKDALLKALFSEGYVIQEKDRIRLTSAGRLVLDEISARLI